MGSVRKAVACLLASDIRQQRRTIFTNYQQAHCNNNQDTQTAIKTEILKRETRQTIRLIRCQIYSQMKQEIIK